MNKPETAFRLPPEFYQSPDVVQIARDLLGKVLVTNFEGQYTAGRITETGGLPRTRRPRLSCLG